MKKLWSKRLALVVAAMALAVGLMGQSAYAAVTLRFPGESPGVPAYARIGPGAIHTDEWAAVPFYRLPSCVPADFNLLRLQDPPRAFRCPLTVEGYEVWERGPGQDPAPQHVVTRGTDVPIWFASWPELQAAMSDGVLTIGELSGLDSLVMGTADVYQEVLRPGELIVVNAHGTLADGRSFQLHTHCLCQKQEPVTHIRIG
ncbi:MAG: hypothetical protein M3179_02810 [Actinomycetota bacterium]|nr:hypothetical protein [Actinomycetota bacterium]